MNKVFYLKYIPNGIITPVYYFVYNFHMKLFTVELEWGYINVQGNSTIVVYYQKDGIPNLDNGYDFPKGTIMCLYHHVPKLKQQ